MSKSIKDYVKPKEDLSKLQAVIESALFIAVNEQREKDGLTWQQLTEACFRRYLDESRR